MFFKTIICSIFILFILNIGKALDDDEIIISTKPLYKDNIDVVKYHQKCILAPKNISSIHSKSCINLYKEVNCTGDYIAIKSGTPGNTNLAHWEGDFDNNIRSIGPCHSDCHPDNIETVPQNKSIPISFYSYTHYRGHQEDLIIENNCVRIPRTLKERVHSIKIKEPVCIQLYEFPDCTGKSSRLPKGSPFHSNLARWNLEHFSTEAMDSLEPIVPIVLDGAVSLCGYPCTISNSTQDLQKIDVQPGQNSVFLYSMSNYQGIHEEIILGNGCRNLPIEWEGEALSIKTFENQCVTIYELIGCNSTGKYLDLNDSNEDIKRNLTIEGFDRLIRSVKLCGDTTVVDNIGTFSENEDLDSKTVSSCKCDTSHIFLYILIVIFIICLLVSFLATFRFWKISQNCKELLRNKYMEQQFSQAVYNSEHSYANLL